MHRFQATFYRKSYLSIYAGVLEMAQKVIEGGVVTCITLRVTLRWLKIRREMRIRGQNSSIISIRGLYESKSMITIW